MEYPIVSWGSDRAEFLPAGAMLPTDAHISAALVFAISEGKFVLADIEGRGWCIPGGHLEPGETAEQAARRELAEEIGATVGVLHLLGTYLVTDSLTSAAKLIPTYVAEIETLSPLTQNTESKGIRLATPEEIPACYFTWDALMESVFNAALATYRLL